MATRMQQRRGTAAQWTAANPTLAAGEIGFETDTNQFKIGNGSSAWSALSYFKNLDGLDGVGGIVTLNANGMIDINLIPQGVALDAELSQYVDDHNNDTTGVHGISNTAHLVYQTDLSDTIATEVVNRNDAINSAISTEVGDRNDAISAAITSEVANRDSAIDDAIALEVTNRNSAITDAIASEVSARDLAIDDAIETEVTNRNNAISTDIGTHNSDTTGVHGILDTNLLATTSDVSGALSDAEAYADTAVSTHNSDTTDVHGISDTANLVYTNDSRLSDTRTPTDNTVSEAKIVDGAVTSAKIADGTIVNADINASAAIDWTKLAMSSTVSATELGYVDGVTSSIQTQLDGKALTSHSHAQSDVTNLTTDLAAKAPLASPTFTGTLNAADVTITGNLTVEGTTTTVNATDLIVSDPLIYIGEGNTANLVDLGLVSSFNDGTYQHSGIVRDSSAGIWKIFKGVTDEPTATINFAQGSLDNLAVNNVQVAGVVFTDGTQTKEGVASRTTIVQKAAAYTLSALTERDNMIEVSHTGGTAVDITVPTDSTLNFPVGTSIDILRTNTGGVRVVGASGVTVNSTPGAYLRAQWSAATLFKRAANTWVLIGDLATA